MEGSRGEQIPAIPVFAGASLTAMVLPMAVRTRKLIGTIVLLLFLGAYVLAAGSVGAGRVASASGLSKLAFFVVAGLAWVVPAALLIRWMQRPDGGVDLKRR